MAGRVIFEFLRSFTGRLVVGMLLVHLLLLPLMAFEVFRIIADEVQQQFVNYARSQSAQYVRVMEQENSRPRMEFLLKDLQLSGQVDFAYFMGVDGELLPNTAETASAAQRFREDFMFGQHGDNVYYIALSVQDTTGKLVGTLRLGYDEKPVKEYIARMVHRGIYLALGYLGLSILLVGTVGTWLARSMRQLRDASRRVAGGEIAESLAVQTNISDVSSLAKDLEYMRSQLVKREAALEAANRINTQTLTSLANAQRIAQLGNWDWRLATGALSCSDESLRLFGLSPLAGKSRRLRDFLRRVHPGDRRQMTHWLGLLKAGEAKEFTHRVVLADGAERIISHHAEVVFNARGEPEEVRCIVQDITSRRQAEERIQHLAYFDSLTGLPNRQMFSDQLSRALAHARRHSGLLAVLFLDLDGFKQINDTLGHNYGDMLLQHVSRRLSGCLRDTDYLSRSDSAMEQAKGEVARLGGDEFTVILSELAQPEDAAVAAQRILDALNQPYRLDAHEVFVSASIGIAIFPHDGDSLETLVMNADTSMYHAKNKGRSCYQFYHKSMNADALAKLSLRNHLHRALEREEFVLHYQPKVDATAGIITGVEALIRWRHPELGLVGSADFIPQAEETGLIMPISDWVLNAACRQAAAWQDAGFRLSLAVNISGIHFKHHSLVPLVAEALRTSGLDPRSLELEVTEGTLMQDVESTLGTLNALKAMGVKISIDDFGTGYSSLNYLKRFPLDAVKIDRSFVQDITSDPDDAAITMAIIALASTLKLDVVAEGVESSEQVEFLRQRGCRIMQGFFFSRPLMADALTRLLRQPRIDNDTRGVSDGKIHYL